MCNLIHCGRVYQYEKNYGEQCLKRKYWVYRDQEGLEGRHFMIDKKYSIQEFKELEKKHHLVNIPVEGNLVSCDRVARTFFVREDIIAKNWICFSICVSQKGTNCTAEKIVIEQYKKVIRQ